MSEKLIGTENISTTKGPLYLETDRTKYWIYGNYYYDGEFMSVWMQVRRLDKDGKDVYN